LLLAWAGLALVAVNLVWLPFEADQGVMSLVGRDLLAGRHLYTEVFDAKQPGMHLWYAGLTALLGPGQPAAQAASVLVAAAAGLLASRLVAHRLTTGWVRAWAPVVGVGAMLLTLDEFTLGQGELVACLPAIAALILVRRRGRGGPFLAGVCLGVVAAIKLVLVATPGAAVLAYVVLSRRDRRPLPVLVSVAAGGLVVPAAIIVWLALRGDLAAALHAWFVYPGEVLQLPGIRSVDILVGSVGRFCLLFAPLGLLAAAALPTIVRTRDRLGVALVVWTVVGVGTYLVQVWWSYYLVVLVPPLVALALCRLDALATSAGTRRVTWTVLAALTVPIVGYGAVGVVKGVADGGGVTAASRERIAERVGSYDTIRAEIAAAGLRPGDTLHVFGDTRYQLLAERPYAIATNGWSVTFVPPRRWVVVAGEIRDAAPDVVFVQSEAAAAIRVNGPEVAGLLRTDYVPVRSGPAGTWYRHR
jgi:hypothetical protein